MIILAIETSCDDTCIAVLEIKNKKVKILSNIISSQVKLHQKYGGVYPSLAKREHLKNLPVVFKKAMNKAKNPKIDNIAVTVGPGLEPCLWTGINFAKKLEKELKAPIIQVNHIEAHILTNFMNKNIKLPAISLIVSGGHTQLILIEAIGKYKILGESRDDAAGECFDKTARILGLEYPGGPAISKIAGGPSFITLPRPMIYQKNYDFSFSGLKTAVLYHYKNTPEKTRKSKKYIRAMAKEIQQSIIDVLLKKTLKAARDYRVKTIILGGGVTANQELRKQFKKKFNVVLMPETEFCTDNAVMIGIAAFLHPNKKKKIEANSNLRV